jgi:hypothetical protein
MQIFEAVAARRMTPEDGASMMLDNRKKEGTMTAIWNFLKTLNRSKVVNGIAAFFGLVMPILALVLKWLPPDVGITLVVSSVFGVLSRAQYVFQEVVPLMDGSAVVQVKPPTPSSVSGVQASLVSVAVNPQKVSPVPVVQAPMVDPGAKKIVNMSDLPGGK